MMNTQQGTRGATEVEQRIQVIEFAATFPTPNVRRAVEYAQSGRLTWGQVYDLFKLGAIAAAAEAEQNMLRIQRDGYVTQ